MTRILIKTKDGRLINYDNVAVIEPSTNNIRARFNGLKDITIFYGELKQVEAWMKAFSREFECAGNLPTYIIDVNDEAKEVQ